MKYLSLILILTTLLFGITVVETEKTGISYNNTLTQNELYELYTSEGYLDVMIVSKNDTLQITPNIHYKMGYPKVLGNSYFSEKQLTPVLEELDFEYFTRTNLDDMVSSLLNYYSNSGFPFAEVSVIGYSKNEYIAFPHIKIESNEFVRIGYLKFSGNDVTKSRVLSDRTRIEIPSVFSDDNVKKGGRYLSKTELFLEEPEYSIVKGNDGYGVLYDVLEDKYNSIDGIAGYSSGDNKNEGFWGEIELYFGNIFGTMRKASIGWRRTADKGERIYLSYTEPKIYKYFLSTTVSFEQNSEDSLYLERKYGVKLNYEIDANFDVFADYRIENLFPHATNDLLLRTDKYYYGGGFRFTTIYNKNILNNGVDLSLTAYTIEKEVDGEKADGYDGELVLDFLWQRKILDKIYFRQRNGYNQIFSQETSTYYDRIKFGGVNDVRGYFEDQFASDVLVFSRNELVYSLDRTARLYSFIDLGTYNPLEVDFTDINDLEYIYSVGAGLVFITNIGQMDINYAYPVDEGFESSKIHIKYTGRF